MATEVAKREPRTMRTWDTLQMVRDEMENLWTNLMGDRGESWLSPVLVPPLDLTESANSMTVRIDLPGIKPEEIDIQLSDHSLTIRGERAAEKTQKGETIHRLERRSGRFSRMVSLPCAVADDKVDARYNDGVLTITLPKSEEAKSHKIKVKG